MLQNPSDQLTIYSAQGRSRSFLKALYTILKEVPAAHRLAIRLFKRDLKAQYRQSFLGIFWALIPPITTSALWIFLKGNKVVDFGETVISYPLFVITGTLLWQVFTDSFNAPLKSLKANKSILVKLNVPREGLLLSGVYSMFFNLFIKLVLLGVTFVYFGQSVSINLLLFPLGVLSIVICGLALGLLFVPVGMLYGDVQRIISLGLPFAMYLTPVIYPPKTEGFIGLLLKINPMATLLNTTREWFTNQSVTDYPTMIYISIGFVLLLCVGLAIFKISMPVIIERIGN